VHLRKRRKQRRQLVFRDADARVTDLEAQGYPHVGFLAYRDADCHLALAGELDRVGSEVAENLLKPARVAPQKQWDIRVDNGNELKALFLGLDREHLRRVFYGGTEVKIEHLQI